MALDTPQWSDWTPQASDAGLGIGSSLKQMISCAGVVAAHVVLTKYGWVKTLQPNLCSTLEWKAGFLNWCESGPWHNTLTAIQLSFYSIGWISVAGGVALRLQELLGLRVHIDVCILHVWPILPGGATDIWSNTKLEFWSTEPSRVSRSNNHEWVTSCHYRKEMWKMRQPMHLVAVLEHYDICSSSALHIFITVAENLL